jgi:hypothetical protein
VYRAAVHNGIVANGNIIANSGWRGFISRVDNGPILNIHFIPHFNKMDIATDYGIEPNTALIAHNDIAHYRGIFCNKTIFGDLGIFTFYGF